MNKFFLVIFSIILVAFSTDSVFSKTKQKKKKAAKTVKVSTFPSTLLTDTVLYQGLKYKNILFGSRATKISANILEIDLSDSNLKTSVLKAKKNINELDKLQEIIRFNDSTDKYTTLGAINASFWKAYRNNPIGACIIDGNIVEMNPYKEWSGFFLDDKGTPYIENFKIDGTVKLHDKKIISISNVNRRRDSVGVVFYNIYGGNVIPYVNIHSIDKIISKAYSDLMQDTTFLENDSTEKDFDYAEFESNIIESARAEQLESSIYKAVIEYIDKPGINNIFRGIVNYIDTGVVKINENQAVLSLGYHLPPDLVVYAGDTLIFSFKTNIHNNISFKYAATATPRLVRKGIAGHEAFIEGSKSRRFINGGLGRTSLGYNENKDKLYLVTIDHANRSAGKKGASLSELAQIMKQIGCYDAMNLDGGGSSTMVIDGKNIMSKNKPEASRKIAVSIGVRIKTNNKN